MSNSHDPKRSISKTVEHQNKGSTEHFTATRATATSGDSSATEIPSEIGDYEILEIIGRGGMGVVYRARQKRLNRIVALKMVQFEEHAGDNEIRRFEAEAEAAAALDHPHIVPIFEFGEVSGRRSFSMAYIEGNSLSDRLREGPIAPWEGLDSKVELAQRLNS